MVKATDINKDIKSIAEKVGTAVFSYNEIHNSKIKNNFHYDYQKVIDEVSRLNGRDMTEELVGRGLLQPLPNGEYKVNVGNSTRNGGGLNYAGTAFFSFSPQDYQTIYHELAHSLQRTYDLFNKEKMDRVYAEAEKKLGGKEKAEGKLIDRGEYSRYLNEMHSESFAYAALMLRAKNPMDFAWQALKTYGNGVSHNFASLLDFRKQDYEGDKASTKYYTSYSVMKETIKQIWKIRKAKKQGDFFDENGVLKDEKLARLSEQTVIKSAYTPRTLNTLFKNKFFSKTLLHENGWRRDMVKSVLNTPLISLYLAEHPSPLKLIEHTVLRYKEKKKIKKFLNSSYLGTDKAAEALHKYSQIMYKGTQLFGMQDNAYLAQTYMRSLVQNGGLSEMMNNYAIKKTYEATSEFKIKNKKAVKPFLESFNRLVKENKDNPYFMALCRCEMPLDEMFKLQQRKIKNENQPVLDLDELAKRVPQTGGFGYFPIVAELKKVAAFADKYDKSGALKKNLEKAFVRYPGRLEDIDFRAAFFQAYAAPIKARKEFEKDLNECLNSAAYTYLKEKNNPQFTNALQYLSQNGGNNMLAVAEQKLSEEREARKHKKETDDNTISDKEEGFLPQKTEALQQNSEPEKAPKEKVAEKLKAWGIEDGSYMMLTPEENAKTSYLDGFRSTESYFSQGAKDIAETSKDVVYGTNNGLIGAYFAEGVYVVSASDKLKLALYNKGVDNGLGVMLSNGEKFDNQALNERWTRIKANGDKVSEEMRTQYLLRQQRLDKEQKQTAGDTVYKTMQNIARIADKHDTSGQLKDELLCSYTQNAEKMLTLQYWGNVVQKHAETSPEGRETCIKELGALGLTLGKELKNNKGNNYYTDIKKSCADGKNGDEILKISRKFASNSLESDVNAATTVRMAATR